MANRTKTPRSLDASFLQLSPTRMKSNPKNGGVHFHIKTSVIPRGVFKEVGITLTPIPASQL